MATFISPAIFWPLAFFGLIFPYLLLFNFFFLIFWLIKWNKLIFISLFTILIGFNHIFHVAPSLRLKRNLIEKKGEDLKILSYNVRAFNLFDWINDPNTDRGIFNFIRSENPDVICLQEFYFKANSSSTDAKHPLFFKDIPYQHVRYIAQDEKNTGFGIATFSRYPIVKTGTVHFENTTNLSIYTDIQVHDDTIRIYNNHLQSLRFRKNNYRFLEKAGRGESEKNIEEIRDISSRLKDAYIKRAKQTDKIKALMNHSPYPIIVCGDFNDTPVSYTYSKMQRGLEDAFLKAGKGKGDTYMGKVSVRIDYILYSKEFEAIDFEKVEANLSDHYPIISVLRK